MQFIKKINNPNLIIETQKEIKLKDRTRALIDLFLQQLNIAIEVDEKHHTNSKQYNLDIERENSINTKISESCIGEFIQFERLRVDNISLEKLNERINEVVFLVKDKINNRVEPLIWKTKEQQLNDIKNKGIIELDDCFDSNTQIINFVYNRNYSGWQKATYKSLWFPVISEIDKDGKLRLL